MIFVSPVRLFGQDGFACLSRARRRLSPVSSMRWALWTRRHTSPLRQSWPNGWRKTCQRTTVDECAIKRELRRRSAVEPVIGHLKTDHRMGRNFLAHAVGDAINAVLAAAGYNFRRLLAWLAILCAFLLAELAGPTQAENNPVTP